MKREPMEALESYYAALVPSEPVARKRISWFEALIGSSIGLAAAGIAVAVAIQNPPSQSAGYRGWASETRKAMMRYAAESQPSGPKLRTERATWRV